MIISVTGCSTCSRVFISRKKKRPSAPRMNSTVPSVAVARGGGERERRRRRFRRAAPPAGSRAGASSTIFWKRRCTEHSRSNEMDRAALAVAERSAPRCGAGVRHRSRRRCARRRNSAAPRWRRCARPRASSRGGAHDAHALAAAARRRLDQQRKADRLAAASRRPRGRRSRPPRAHRARPALAAKSRAEILSPISAIVSASGPMKTSPAACDAPRQSARSRTGSRSRDGSRRRPSLAPPRRSARSSRWAATGVSPEISTASSASRACGGARLDRVMDGDRFDPERAQRAHDAAGDLAAVGDQDLTKRNCWPSARCELMRWPRTWLGRSAVSVQPSSHPPGSSQAGERISENPATPAPSALPCGSWLSEATPPPPSARCSRKLKP